MAQTADNSKTDSDTVKMNLNHTVTINGERFPAGKNVEVPRAMAEDAARIDHDHNEYEKTLHRKREFTQDLGEMGVGGGS
jgi:hypothetical protein